MVVFRMTEGPKRKEQTLSLFSILPIRSIIHFPFYSSSNQTKDNDKQYLGTLHQVQCRSRLISSRSRCISLIIGQHPLKYANLQFN